MNAKVEAQLLQALDVDEGLDELLEVVLSFEAPAAQTSTQPNLMKRREERAAAMSSSIDHALARAGEIAGTQPTHVTRFPLTGSAFVQAPRSYVRALMEQGEVAGAMLNKSRSIA